MDKVELEKIDIKVRESHMTSPFGCPKCGSKKWVLVQARERRDEKTIKKFLKCGDCGYKFK